jgi:hypothetical protein
MSGITPPFNAVDLFDSPTPPPPPPRSHPVTWAGFMLTATSAVVPVPAPTPAPDRRSQAAQPPAGAPAPRSGQQVSAAGVRTRAGQERDRGVSNDDGAPKDADGTADAFAYLPQLQSRDGGQGGSGDGESDEPGEAGEAGGPQDGSRLSAAGDADSALDLDMLAEDILPHTGDDGIFEVTLPNGQTFGVAVSVRETKTSIHLSSPDAKLGGLLRQRKMELQGRLQRHMRTDVEITVL